LGITPFPTRRSSDLTGDEIARRLGDAHNQKLLAAASGKYDSARWRHRGRIAIGGVLAVLAPIAVIYVNALQVPLGIVAGVGLLVDRKSTRLNSSHQI